MIEAKCIKKFRNKYNQILGYRLQDAQGNIKDVTSEQLKNAIKNGQITIVNLTLTADNRLIDTKQNNKQLQKTNQQSIVEEKYIKDIISVATVTGNVAEIQTACEHKCILISISDTEHIVYVPDNVTVLNTRINKLDFTGKINNLHGNIKIIGGHSLKDTSFMFYECRAETLDLACFDTKHVTNMRGMFTYCQTQNLNLEPLNTDSVESMEQMFYECKAESINLSSFNTNMVLSMKEMFEYSKVKSLDLSSFNTHRVNDMSYMFSKCEVEALDLSSFDTKNVKNMSGMFSHCKLKSLDLSSFNTSKVTNMNSMFSDSKIMLIDLSSFDTGELIDVSYMFYGCQSKLINLLSFKLSDRKVGTDRMLCECKAEVRFTDSKILESYNMYIKK